jgi:hypothetical protein
MTEPCQISIITGLTSKKSTESFELTFSRRALALLKTRLGSQGLKDLLASDIAQAERYWRQKLADSDGKFRECSVKLSATGLSAEQFLTWFKSHVEDMPVMLAAHPEHYINGFGTILETLGQHVSLFELRMMPTPADCVRNRDEDMYPIALNAAAVLADGAEMGYACHQFRNIPSLGGVGGFEAYLAGFMPQAVEDHVIETQRQHLVVEWTNWIRAAYADLT